MGCVKLHALDSALARDHARRFLRLHPEPHRRRTGHSGRQRRLGIGGERPEERRREGGRRSDARCAALMTPDPHERPENRIHTSGLLHDADEEQHPQHIHHGQRMERPLENGGDRIH